MSALGKTVIVTGGMSGIGAAVVEMLAQSDFIRVAIDIKPRADIQLRAPAVRWDQPFDVSDEAEFSRVRPRSRRITVRSQGYLRRSFKGSYDTQCCAWSSRGADRNRTRRGVPDRASKQRGYRN